MPSAEASVEDWLGLPQENPLEMRSAGSPPTTRSPATIPPVVTQPRASSTLGSVVAPPPTPVIAHGQPSRSGTNNRRIGAGGKPSDSVGFLDWNSSSLIGLFDWKFREFITPSIVSSLYTSHLILVALASIGLAFGNYWLFFNSPNRGQPFFYVMLVGVDLLALLVAFAWTLVVRLCLEAVMVIFRSEEHLRTLAEMNRD